MQLLIYSYSEASVHGRKVIKINSNIFEFSENIFLIHVKLLIEYIGSIKLVNI
jgi:hypothetical protein